MKPIEFETRGIPTAKGRPRVMKSGFTYTPKKTKVAEESFLVQALNYKPERPIDQPIKIEMEFYFPIPKGTSKKKRETLKWYDKRPDIDNLGKLCMDALDGIFYLDDKQITDLNLKKYHTEDYPKTIVKIELLQNDDNNS